MLSSKHSFRLILRKEAIRVSSDFNLKENEKQSILELENRGNIKNADIIDSEIDSAGIVDYGEESENLDDKKRSFLKVLGVVGAGAVAASMLPRKADALVFGSTPTSNTVGIKNASNVKINPATQETLAAIKAQSDLLTFDSGSNPANLKVNIAVGNVGVKNAGGSVINPATDETLSSLLTGQGVTKLSVNLSSSGNVRVPAAGKKIRVYASRFSLTADATSVSFRFTSGGTDHEKYLSPKTGGLYGSNNHPNFIEGGVDQALYCVIDGTTTVQINIDYLEV